MYVRMVAEIWEAVDSHAGQQLAETNIAAMLGS